MTAAANVIELPTAAHLRKKANEAEAELEQFASTVAFAARMFWVAQQTADGLEEICNTEKARAELAAAALAERDDRLRLVAAEIEGLQREVASLRSDLDRQQQAHEMGVAVLRQMLDRRQAELEAAQGRAAELEKQLAELEAARVTDARRALAVAINECAGIAERRAEGWGIAAEIRDLMVSA